MKYLVKGMEAPLNIPFNYLSKEPLAFTKGTSDKFQLHKKANKSELRSLGRIGGGGKTMEDLRLNSFVFLA